MKITVIATGFGVPSASRPLGTQTSTPVDLTQYGDQPRMRADRVPSSGAAAASGLSIARRPLLDLSGSGSSNAAPAKVAASPAAVSARLAGNPGTPASSGAAASHGAAAAAHTASGADAPTAPGHAPANAPASPMPSALDLPDMIRPKKEAAAGSDADFDLSSAFDVPAFLRRQEG